MTPTATQILDHCKAVVEGRKPQPLPFWVERNADRDYYAINDGMPDPDGFGNPPNTMYIHFEDNDMTPSDWQLAARILGLDRPAPVVELEWAETKTSEYCAHCAHFNNLIEAYISTNKKGNVRFAPRVYVNGSGVSEMHIFDKHTLEEARAWCVEQITKIITPTPTMKP